MAKDRNLLWVLTMACSVLALLCSLPVFFCGRKVKLVVYIPPGEFMMGSPDGEEDRDSGEGPQHSVKISKGFYMGVTEVTQAQWLNVMGYTGHGNRFRGEDLPEDSVSWDDAVEFCRRLSKKEGKSYRLPTEAEWEYACRAGTTTRSYFGESVSQFSDYAWYSESSGSKTHRVGTKKPNAFGLYDMHGNVYEWCSDWYASYPSSPQTNPTGPTSGSSRVIRGGSWYTNARSCRVASRYYHDPTHRDTTLGVGFRLVLDLN